VAFSGAVQSNVLLNLDWQRKVLVFVIQGCVSRLLSLCCVLCIRTKACRIQQILH